MYRKYEIPIERPMAGVWLLFGLLVLVPVWTLHAAEQAKAAECPYKTQNVILIVVDGARYTETWGDPKHAFVPNLAANLGQDGVINKAFFNKGHTVTIPGHTALVTGFYQNLDNNGGELPNHPTITQRWLKGSGGKPESAWVIVSKSKLALLANSSAAGWKDRYVAAVKAGQSDEVTMATVKNTLTRDHPRLVVINLAEPDGYGHMGNWKAYTGAIKASDEYTEEIWRLVQKDPVYKDKTAVFMTNDHGRHSDGVGSGFRDHGCKCEGCRHVLLWAAGPDFQKNIVVGKERDQIDVPVTIAFLMGFKIENSAGDVMTELFEANSPAAKAAEQFDHAKTPVGVGK